jgi:RNA polymerase sigma-70 factor (ECF subfamily)
MDVETALSRLRLGAADTDDPTLAILEIMLERAPDLRPAIEAAAVPHWFDASIISRLLEIETAPATTLYERLCALPVVESFPSRRGSNVHEATRLALRNRLFRREPERFKALAARAHACFADSDMASRVEAIYHCLIAAPQVGATELCNARQRWAAEGRDEWLQSLGLAVAELLRSEQLSPEPRGRALLYHGSSARERSRSREVEANAREALQIFHEVGWRQGEFDALSQLGEVLLRRGDSSGALIQFERCVELLERTPETEEQQYQLWLVRIRRGQTLLVQDKLVEASLAHEGAIEIAQRHVAAAPDDTRWRLCLSSAHGHLGRTRRVQSHLPAAIAAYQASEHILRQLTENDPENSSLQRELAHCLNEMGAVLQMQRKLSDALCAHTQSKEIIGSLLARDRDNPAWLYEMSMAHNGLGNVLQFQREYRQALAEFQAAREILQRLSDADPDNTDWQSELARSHCCIASALSSLDERPAALREAETSRDILERMTKLDPANTRWQKDRFEAHRLVAALSKVEGLTAQASREYDASVPFAELRPEMMRAYQLGRMIWPGILVSPDVFGQHCERVLGSNPEWDWTRFGTDLYLCCGCARGDAEATRVLEAETLPQVVKAIGRIESDPEFVEEALQLLRDKLLVGPRAKIADYAGRGPLVAWLSVSAARVALDLIRSRNARKLQHAALSDELSETDTSPLNDIVKSRYAESFQRALKAAISSLPSRERNLLRLQLVGRCSIDQLGRMYLVHPATAARWLEGARNRVFESVREQMKMEHHLTDGEFDSVARGVRSHLDLAISEYSVNVDDRQSSASPVPDLDFEDH